MSASKKPSKKREARPPATAAPKGGFRQSQRAEIPEAALSPREQKVLGVLRGTEGEVTVRQLARRCFPGMRAKPGLYETVKADGERLRHGTGAAYRCVLNSLRRLVVGGYVKKVARGTYAAVRSDAPTCEGPLRPAEPTT